jgi:hypothetical protein
MKRNFNFNKSTCQFTYTVDEFDPIITNNYLEAIDLSVTELYNDAKLKNINQMALCLSGIDSELIANSLYNLKIPCEYFFLHIQNINDDMLEGAKLISQNHNTKLNVFKITVDNIFDYIIDEIFQICPVMFPGYVVGAILTKFIPKEFYVIMGEGDIEKNNVNKYLTIYNNSVKDFDNQYIYIPLHLSEILYNQCLTHYNKQGEGNFYSRNFNTWYHILKDSRLRTNFKFFYDPKSSIIFPDYHHQSVYKKKTDNFVFGNNADVAIKIMSHLKKTASVNWSPYIGTTLRIPKNLLQ